jgi:tetratricopeptide (TPR) repeat protein
MPSQEAKYFIDQGLALINAGQLAQGASFLENALAIMQRIYGQDQIEMVDCLQALGDCQEKLGRWGEALVIRCRLLELGQKVLGANHPDVITIMLKIALLQERLGLLNDAVNTIQEAIELAKSSIAREHPLAQRLIEYFNYLQVKSLNPPTTPPSAPAAPFGAPTGLDTMQDYARQMLAEIGQAPQDMPRHPFSTTVRQVEGSLSLPSVPIIRQQEAKALDPNLFASNLPEGVPGEVNYAPSNQAKDSGVLGYRPEISQTIENLREDYSIEEIRNIAGRSSGTTIAASNKARKFTENDDKAIRLKRLIHDYALPAVGLLIVIGLVLFLSFGGKKQDQTNNLTKALQAVTREQVWSTADGLREIRLRAPAKAVLVSPDKKLEVSYRNMEPSWGDIFSAMFSSLAQKQIWFDNRGSVILSEDQVTYYRKEGQEFKTIEKMQQLAGLARAIYVRSHQYPRVVPPALANYFEQVNPYTGQVESILIKPIPSVDHNGIKAVENLESGRILSSDTTPEPGVITCFAVLDDEGEQIRCTDFYVRGFDANKELIQSSIPGKALALEASDKYFNKLAPVAPSGSSTANSKKKKPNTGKSTPNKSSQNQQKKHSQAATQSLAVVQVPAQPQSRKDITLPEKATVLLLMRKPPFPLTILHYLLPIILGTLSLLGLVRSKMVAVDYKGKTVAEGSALALVIALIFLALTVLTLILQKVVFA